MKVMSPYALYEILQRPGRLIGMDVGSKFVGLAVSDLQYKFAAPYGFIERFPKNPQKTHQMALKIQKLVTDLSAPAFIIGYPYISGKIEPSLTHVPDFIQELIWSGMFKGMPYTLWDESFTTKAVREMFYPLVLPKELEKSYSDMFAATGILQGYLDCVNMHEKYLLELAMPKEVERKPNPFLVQQA